MTASGALLSRIIGQAREAHAFFKNGSARPMSEYISGLCYDASIRLIAHLAKSDLKVSLNDIFMVQGVDVPGSTGEENHRFENISFRGVHYLAFLVFRGFSVAVDITAAQLTNGRRGFNKTEALLIVCDPAQAQERLAEIYGGGKWERWVSHRVLMED